MTLLTTLRCRLLRRHRETIVTTPWSVWAQCLDCAHTVKLGPVCPEGHPSDGHPVTKPLNPAEVNELLRPNPPSWGADGFPAGFTLFGLPVIVTPDLTPPGPITFDSWPPEGT